MKARELIDALKNVAPDAEIMFFNDYDFIEGYYIVDDVEEWDYKRPLVMLSSDHIGRFDGMEWQS